MVFREGTEFTVKEIAEASGRSEANIALRHQLVTDGFTIRA